MKYVSRTSFCKGKESILAMLRNPSHSEFEATFQFTISPN
jgi:hypothetical protein